MGKENGFNFKGKVNSVKDFYRIAPFGESLAAIDIVNLLASRTPTSIESSLASLVVCIMVTRRQFKLKNRLEESISEDGYEDEVMKKTIPTWCNRQTAGVVAEKLGKREQYKELCKKNKKKMEFKYIPNF